MIEVGRSLGVSLKNGGRFRSIVYVALPFTVFDVTSIVVIIDITFRFAIVMKDTDYVFL